MWAFRNLHTKKIFVCNIITNHLVELPFNEIPVFQYGIMTGSYENYLTSILYEKKCVRNEKTICNGFLIF